MITGNMALIQVREQGPGPWGLASFLLGRNVTGLSQHPLAPSEAPRSC